MKLVSLELSKEDLDKLQKDFRDNAPLEERFHQHPANAASIAYIINRSPSTIRRWGLAEKSPLYPILAKLYSGEKSPWVCTLGDLWQLRSAVLKYRSGPPTRVRQGG